MDQEQIIEQIKETVPEINPNFTSYSIYEFEKFYLVSSGEDDEPILFEKNLGLPMFKNFASIPPEDCQNPELIEEVGSDEEDYEEDYEEDEEYEDEE